MWQTCKKQLIVAPHPGLKNMIFQGAAAATALPLPSAAAAAVAAGGGVAAEHTPQPYHYHGHPHDNNNSMMLTELQNAYNHHTTPVSSVTAVSNGGAEILGKTVSHKFSAN